MDTERRQTIEYKFLRQNTHHPVPKKRYTFVIYLALFHVAFVVLMGFFSKYDLSNKNGTSNSSGLYAILFHFCFIILFALFTKYDPIYGQSQVPGLYAMFMDVHSMMFIGFGFLMTFLKRYGYGAVGLNFIIAAFVLEWSILVRGWLEAGINGEADFTINIKSLLVADFCAAAVLISFGAVIGKASLSQLIVMATFEVVIQGVNELIGLHYLQAYDVGESIYVHVFGAYFGLAVSKVLQGTREIESTKESSHYHSDLFAMIGTIFLFLYWPSFNSAVAVDEGQTRAIINTFLGIASSCVATFIISLLVGKGRLNMVHVQNATLAGGVAVGAVADMQIEPFGAMIIGTVAGIISTLGFQFLTPTLNETVVHDTCGVNNLHGMPGLLSGIASAIVAATATRENYNGNRLYVFYPSRTPMSNSTEYSNFSLDLTEFSRGGMGRTAAVQGGYQMAALAVTLGMAIIGGIITGYIMKLPIIEQIQDIEEMFDDEPNWLTPEDYSLKLTEVRVQNRESEEEMQEKRVLHTST
ncbi:ammonium transporter Rh type B-like [Brachionus plicatilis]|uniref:Ammonium transporter Rh type B-like n=1 Tax=Brachionus plicatilis TaxID=10195 RepID=A0A3M7RV63_BRAPC|nr:ammonium transporter Rh type B-like [Brachionus plicatilis]